MDKRLFWLAILFLAVWVRTAHADETTSSAVQTSTTALVPPVSTATVTSPTANTPVNTPTVVPPPSVPATALPGVMPKAPRSFLNEMAGTVLSVDNDANTVRITVEGGFNVDFAFTDTTVITEDGKPLAATDLNYGDKIVVHYAGKDLLARQIERTSKASTDPH